MSEHDPIRDSSSGLRSLGDVLAWTREFDPPAEVVDIVGLDEFTNDVVVRVGPDVYAVFDTT